jgi:hypothetical protein
LYRVEVEEPFDEDGEHSAWSRAMLVERYGKLNTNKGREAALALMTQVIAYHQHPSFYRDAKSLDRLDEYARIVAMGRKFLEQDGPPPTDRALATGYRPLIFMSRALTASSDEMAWVFAASIGTHIMDKSLRLDMARALSEVLE